MNDVNAGEDFLTDRIDLRALEKWLQEKLAADAQLAISSATIPKTGYSAITVLIDADITGRGAKQTRSVVLRLEKTGQHIFLDTDIAKQGQMMMALGKSDIPVPRIVGVEIDTSVLGGKFLVMDRLHAHSLPQSPNYRLAGLLPALDSHGRRRLWCDAVSTIAKINRLDWRSDFQFLNNSRFGPPGLDQYLGWLQAWRDEATDNTANSIIDTAIDRLLREKPDDTHVDVLWGDSNPGNYLFNDDGRLASVLDFEAAALGPAEIDLAWWLFMDEMLTFGTPSLEGLPDRDEQISLYESTLGRSVDSLAYYELLAAVRIALVIARTALLLIKAGRLPETNKTAYRNPAVQLVAGKLGISGGETGEDYMAFAGVLNER